MKIFTQLNYLLVIAAAVISFALDAVWHSAKIFGKIWEEQTGFPRVKKGEPPRVRHMAPAFMGYLLTALGIAYFIKLGGGTGILNGLETGLVIAVLFSLTAHLETAVYQKKVRLYWVTAGFQAVSVIIMACLLGWWQK